MTTKQARKALRDRVAAAQEAARLERHRKRHDPEERARRRQAFLIRYFNRIAGCKLMPGRFALAKSREVEGRRFGLFEAKK